MDFIFNSRSKKVEIFYDNEAEQKALFEFLGKHMKFRTGGIPTDNTFINGPEISWTTINTQPPYTISTTDNLSGTITLNNGSASTIDTDALNQTITNSIESNLKKAAAAASIKLDESSEEGGYNYLTASVPHKTK